MTFTVSACALTANTAVRMLPRHLVRVPFVRDEDQIIVDETGHGSRASAREVTAADTRGAAGLDFVRGRHECLPRAKREIAV
jgi:hypothetical protein